MVFLWAWRLQGWRWLVHNQQNIPKYVSGIVFGSLIANIIKTTNSELHELEGFTNSYEANVSVAGHKILDDKKIVTLAARRLKMLKDKEEAKAYFEQNGYKPRATNQQIMLNDSLGY